MPRSVFETRNGNIVLKQQYRPHDDIETTPVFGSLAGESGTLQLCATSTHVEIEPGQFLWKVSDSKAALSALDDRFVAFSQVPPLTWLFDLGPPEPRRVEITEWTSDWAKWVAALMQYYLLVWAFEERHSGYVPGPNPDHLQTLFYVIKGGSHYEQTRFRREHAKFYDQYISEIGDKKQRDVQHARQADAVRHHHRFTTSTEAQHATASDGADDVASISTIEEILREMSQPSCIEAASSRATPPIDTTGDQRENSRNTFSARSPIRTHLSEPLPETEQSTKSQQPDPGSSAGSSGIEDGPSTMLAHDWHTQEFVSASIPPTAPTRADDTMEATRCDSPQIFRAKESSPQSIPSLDGSGCSTPAADALAEAVFEPNSDVRSGVHAPAVDEHLAHLQTKVGHDLLSLLPDLRTTMFKRLHPSQDRPGYLSIRMLFGKGNQSAPAQLRGGNVWIVCKVHEKDARTAPRMLLDALSSDDKDLIEENIAFKSMLPCLDLEPVFNIITEEGLKREHQIKAVVKYYFVLAANAKLHDFKQHLMPANDTFVDQMRTVCRRIQNNEAAPKPRKRRRLALEHTAGVSFTSNSDNESPIVPKLPGRRSGRSLNRPLSATDTITEHQSRVTRHSTPRVALGPIIQKDAPSHIKNHFLDADAEPCDSDGDSGDEIPAGVPDYCHDWLLRRAESKRMVQVHNFWIKEHRDKKNDCTKAARKLEWLVSHGKETLGATQHRIKTEKRLASKWQGRIEVRQEAIWGFRNKEREYDVLVKGIDKSFVRLWDAEQKQKEEHERKKQSQQALDGLQKPQ